TNANRCNSTGWERLSITLRTENSRPTGSFLSTRTVFRGTRIRRPVIICSKGYRQEKTSHGVCSFKRTLPSTWTLISATRAEKHRKQGPCIQEAFSCAHFFNRL